MNILKLIRYKNLFLIALMQIIFRYGFLKIQHIPVALNDWQFALLVFATVLIAAGGYIINDIEDQEADLINKPKRVIIDKSITENTAFNIYIGLNIIGLLIGFYLSNAIGKNSFFGLFIIISALLYMYATSFKKVMIIGNLIVALILSLSVMILAFFDIIPQIFPENQAMMITYILILLDYAIFAFIINFMREIVKDMEDIDGDYNQGINSLPIVIGVQRANRIVFGIGVIATSLLLWYVNKNLMNSKLYFATIYSLLFVIAPMLFFLVKLWNAQSKKEFHFLSKILKLVIFFGILSILVINLNIKYNAR